MALDRLEARLVGFMRQHNLVRAGGIVVGVSGGPDSLALVHALANQRQQLGLTISVVHLNHRLRGEQADAEAAFVAETASTLGLACLVESHPIATFAAEQQLNQYAAGRAVRYALLARVAQEQQAVAVAMAHTLNDQAETVLMHLLRGAGSDGLQGMRPLVPWEEWGQYGAVAHTLIGQMPVQAAPVLIRPLLGTARDEIEGYCQRMGLAPRRDPANADTRHTRSHVRHILLPQLMAYNPAIVATLGRTAEILAAEHDLIEQQLDQHWPLLVQVHGQDLIIDHQQFAGLALALQRALLRRAYRLVGGLETLGLDDLERVRAVVGRAGKQIELPGNVRLVTHMHTLVVHKARTDRPA